METKFQTSFIPKKTFAPMASASSGFSPQHRSSGASIFMMIAIFVFVISLGGLGGAYAWKQYLITNQDTLKNQLVERKKQFNIDQIQQLRIISAKIDLAKQLLQNHIAISGIFSYIGNMTIEGVRFTSMDVVVPTNSTDGIKVSLNGYGLNLASVAFQSDVLGRLEQYGLRNIVKNPMIGNPSQDNSSGKVSFNLTATLDPSSLSYQKSLSPTATSSANSTN